MSPTTDEHPKDPTQFFSVVGSAYVPESHADRRHHLPERSDIHQPETGVAGLWLIFYAAVIGISLVTSGGAARLIEMAALALQ